MSQVHTQSLNLDVGVHNEIASFPGGSLVHFTVKSTPTQTATAVSTPDEMGYQLEKSCLWH